jgi:hypothetical protein
MVVKFTIDGPAQNFTVADVNGGDVSNLYLLEPQQQINVHVKAKALLDTINQLTADTLYGRRINVTAYQSNPDGMQGKLLYNTTFYLVRYLAVVNQDSPLNASFVKTLNDGTFIRHKTLAYYLPATFSTIFTHPLDVAPGFDFGGYVHGTGTLDWTYQAPPGTPAGLVSVPLHVEIAG